MGMVPYMPKEWIDAQHDGLLIGNACDGGDIARNVNAGVSSETLMRIASFHDYVEIEPTENVTDDLAEQARLQQQILDIIQLGHEAGIPVAAVSNARYRVGRIVGLTGAPSGNGLMDLFAQFRTLDGGKRLGRFIMR